MSLVLDTGTMKYRENPNQSWKPLVIKAGMNWESMADTYDPDNGTYEVGQYVLEEGMMYRCISEITTPEAWTPAHWTSVNVGDELSSFIIISDDQPTDETNKIWIAETTAPFEVQVPTIDDHNALGNTLNQLDTEVDMVENGLAIPQTGSTCTKTGGIPASAFIFLQGHSTLADGIYQNSSGNIIAENANFTNSNLTRCYQETSALNLLNNGLMATAKVYRRDLPASSNLNVVFKPTGVACMVVTSGSVKAGYGTAAIVTGYVTGSRLSCADLKSESTLRYDFSSTTECKFAVINNATNSGVQVTVIDFLGTFKEWSGGRPSAY